jgi:tetratricopeptide (TPR) repeat protein
MRSLCVAGLVICVWTHARADDAGPAAPSATGRHLLTGVRAFKDGRYEEALVELRLVARAPDAPADLAFYLGPTLYKLGRHREALASFVTSHATPDALTAFYLGETCYQLKLYRKARAVFVGLRTRGLGPVLDEAAARYVDLIDAAYHAEPDTSTIDYYAGLGLELADGNPVVAAEYLDEARQVEALAKTRYRHGEIVAALGKAWNATGHAHATVELLAGEPSPTAETSWQLARAYAALGDGVRARPLLEAIVNARGANAAEAAALLLTLKP